LQILLNDLQLASVLVLSLLLVDDQRVPILQGVFSASVEVLDDFRPLLAAPVVADAAQQQVVLLGSPRSLLEAGIEVAVPVFPALLGVAVDLLLPPRQEVQLVRDHLPVLRLLPRPVARLPHQPAQQGGLLSAPVVGGQVHLLQTQPLEHARLCSHPWDQGGDRRPLLLLRINFLTRSFSTSRRPWASLYLAMIQMRICTSSSLQFFLMRLFLAILRGEERTFRCGG
jgi:hypothetical protein